LLFASPPGTLHRLITNNLPLSRLAHGKMVIVLSDGKVEMTDDDCSGNPWDNVT
jgi:hypothetical protein